MINWSTIYIKSLEGERTSNERKYMFLIFLENVEGSKLIMSMQPRARNTHIKGYPTKLTVDMDEGCNHLALFGTTEDP
jgi:hypothetical protein